MAVVLLKHCTYIDVPLRETELLGLRDVFLNRVSHLERTNDELREALAADPDDDDFALALSENEEIVLRVRRQADELAALVAGMRAAASAQRPVMFVAHDDWESVAGPEGAGHVVVGLETAGGGTAATAAAPAAPVPPPDGGMDL
jgi:hypothetical protein